MADHESTMKWKVDIGQMKAAMADAKRSISLASAEFKTATAGLDKWSGSITGLEAKLKQLNTTLPQQKTILDQLQKQYKLTAENMGENSAEAQRLKIQIENQKAAIAKTESSISKYTNQLEEMKDEQSKADSELGKLSKTITEQESALSDLKEEYKNAVLMYGKNSKEAKDLAGQIDKLSGELADNKQTMRNAEKAADDLDKSLEDTEKSTEDLKEGFTVMKGALADLVAQGIKAALDGLKRLGQAAYDAWQEFDEGADNIIAATGATGEAADDLMKAYDAVSGKVVGSFEEIGDAVGEVSSRFGLTGKKLEDTSELFLKFAKLNNTNVKSSIDSVQSAMAAFGLDIDQTSDFLDTLNKAGQDTGVSMDQLSNLLMQNAPALTEMGFSASDAAMFLAGLSKNGVDASSTLGALKKALANATKAGKPMNEAMAEMETAINGAGSETEAMQKAIDLFGSKSGPAIAKAVRSGRLSFKKFGTTITDFRGNIEQTYDAMLDAPDDIALAIQNLRKTAAKIVDNFLKNHGAAIKNAIENFSNNVLPAVEKAVGKVFDFIDQNGSTIVGALKAIATAFITYKAVSTIETVIGSFQKLSGAIKAGQSVMEAFNGTLTMSPIGMAAIAIGAMVSAIISYNQEVSKASGEIKNLSEEEQALIDKINEGAEAYQTAKDARYEDNKAIESSYSYYQNLWDRLDEITNAQGGIQTGYIDEAQVIMNELSEGLGIEFDLRGWQIKNYQDIAKEIDNIILKKKAEAMISANQGAYTEAVQKQAEAFADYSDAVADAEATHQELADAEAVVAEMDAKIQKGQKVNIFEYNNAKGAVSDLQRAYEEQSKAVNTAYETYLDYGATIRNYDALQKAVASGSMEDMNTAINNLTYSFQTHETATKEMLENQLADFDKTYTDMQKAVDEGMVGVTQEQVDSIKEMRDRAAKELALSEGIFEDNGANLAKAAAKGFQSPSAIAANKGSASQVRKDLIAEVDKAAPELEQKGAVGGNKYASGIASSAPNAKAKMQTVANQAKSGAESVDMTGSGTKASNQYATGIGSGKSNAKIYARYVAKAGLEGFSAISARSAGVSFGEGFSNGISSMTNSVLAVARRLASNAVSAMKNTLDSHSPSKVTEAIGGDFDQGFVDGILKRAKNAAAAAKTMASGAVDALKTDMSASVTGIRTNGLNTNGAVYGGATSNTQNVTFNQTINSPKAVDRLTLYRDTNSLLFSAKVGLANV